MLHIAKTIVQNESSQIVEERLD